MRGGSRIGSLWNYVKVQILHERERDEQGKEKGCSNFVIWVLEENSMGIAFYKKNGYSPDGKEKIFKRWNKKEIRYVKG